MPQLTWKEKKKKVNKFLKKTNKNVKKKLKAYQLLHTWTPFSELFKSTYKKVGNKFESKLKTFYLFIIVIHKANYEKDLPNNKSFKNIFSK